MQESGSLACPACGREFPSQERFCADCGLPLTYAGKVDAEESGSDLRQHARKIKPQYAHGELRQVATARQQPESDFIQMLLLEEGIPSTTRRATWDVPEMLAAGPRAVMVPESGYEVALQVLNRSEIEVIAEHEQVMAARPTPLRLLAGLMAALLVVSVVILLLRGLV